jgi:signal transduction histidine kinase/ActR/RegA family two-component response regulator
MIVIDLIYNLAILVAVSVLAGFVDNRWQRHTVTGKVFQGLLFGGVAMIAMLNPFVISPGIIFDGRSVVLSLSALFFGPLAGAIAGILAILLRLYIGGAGTLMGIAVILSSVIIGVIFYQYRQKHKLEINAWYLFLFGVIVHIAMLVLMLTLPSDVRMFTLETIGLTILGTYPLATVLIGKILKDQESNLYLFRNLSESEKQYKSLINEMQQALAVYEVIYNTRQEAVDYRFILVNPNYIKLTRLKESDLIGKTLQEVFPKTEEFWNERYEHVVRTGEAIYYENYSNELNKHYEVVVYRPRTDQLAVILTDITDRKLYAETLTIAKEQAEASDRLKTAFMNNISHEIRTPLNGILGFGQMITQPNISDKERSNFFEILQSSVDRLISTVTDYMDISLIASDNLKVKNISFNLDQLITGLFAQLQTHARNKNLETYLVLPETSKNTILYSDKELLRKALGHLIKNAVKFTNQGNIKLGYTKMNGYLEFFVKDTGVGIGELAFQRIFEAFDQEENTNTRQYEGSGLGLPIAKGIITKLGGKIWAKSEKGKGSEFYFIIPLQNQPDTNIAAVPHENNNIKQGKPLILVAEDDDSNFLYLQVVLNRASFDIIRAADGNEAVKKCRENPNINLVLMDIKLPEMDGFEATRKIKSFRKELPVIGVTAYAISGDENRILEAGFDDYLSKPFKRSTLMLTLNKFGLDSL